MKPTGSTTNASVEVSALSKRFGGNLVVRDINFRVEHGSFVTLLGPSGSGKTTTLRMIAGFEAPTTGSVFIGDRDVTDVPSYKRNIGMVFQHNALFPHMTVFGNVAYPLEMRTYSKKEISKRVEDALSLVGLSEFAARYPKQLSGGQQQRVGLARAIVFNPDVILMDESLGALDRRLRELMQVEIRQLQRRLGITTISVTHDQSEAIIMSDMIAVMDRGTLQQFAPPLQVYRNPANKFVADFIGDSNLLQGAVPASPPNGKPRFISAKGLQIELVAEDSKKQGNYLLLRPEFIKVGSIAAGLQNRYEVEVLQILPLGDLIKYRLRFPSGEEVIAKTLISFADQSLSVGGRVSAGWDSQDCVLIS